MPFASKQDRLDFIEGSPAFGLDFVVQVVNKGKEFEIFCDDFEHAFDTALAWKNVHCAEEVNMQRVNQIDGSLFGGIGSF